MWLDFWARKMNIPYLEYACMPIGEVYDLISVFQISEGIAEEVEQETLYIPNLR